MKGLLLNLILPAARLTVLHALEIDAGAAVAARTPFWNRKRNK